MNWLVAIISAAGAGALVAVAAWIRDLRIRVALAESRHADAQAFAERLAAREQALRATEARATSRIETVRAETRADLAAVVDSADARDASEVEIWRETGVR